MSSGRRLTPRTATVAALLATATIGVVSDLLFVAAFQGRLEWLEQPALAVGAGSSSADLFRWAAVADLCGYYVPIGVVAIALWDVFREGRPVLAFGATLAAAGYVLAGSIGAAGLGMAGSTLIADHARAAVGSVDRSAIAAAFGLLTDVVFRAVWQVVDGILVATWFGALAVLLRERRPALARLTAALACLSLTEVVLTVAHADLAGDVTLGLAFAAWFAWSLWLAALVWRGDPPFDRLSRGR